MIGAGIVLCMFGGASLLVARSLQNQGGDLFALAFIPPMIFGMACIGIGAALILGGSL